MKELINPHSIANSVRMGRSQFSGSFLITEGDTDARLFKNFTDAQSCRVVNAINRNNAVNALQLLEKDLFPGILAIVDADFCRLEDKFPPTANLIYTDCHDIEVLLFSSLALDKVLLEYGSANKIGDIEHRMGRDIRTIIFETASVVGHLRWLSLRDGLDLVFENLTFSKFVEPKTLAIDPVNLIRVIKLHSSKHTLDEARLLESLQTLMEKAHEELQVCCGHDLSAILSFGLRKTLGTHDANEVRPEKLERSLRLAFESKLFEATKIYESIIAWEKNNAPYIILRQISA